MIEERQKDTCTRPNDRLYVEAKQVPSTSRTKSDLPQGTLDLLILQVAARGAIHGYGIAQRIKLVSSDVLQIQQGSLYPALHRLENKGLLIAAWKPTDTGREAKFYRLSAKGRSQLKIETTQWDALTRAVGAILRTPEGSAS